MNHKPAVLKENAAYEAVHQTLRFQVAFFDPVVVPISDVHRGRKRRGEPVRLSLHFPGQHLRLLHLVRAQRRQDVVRYHQEL